MREQITRYTPMSRQNKGLGPRFAMCLCGVLFCWLSSAGGLAWGDALKAVQEGNQRCFGLFKSKDFLKAIDCYQVLRKLNKNPQYLVSIAQSYRLASLKEPSPERAAFLSEKSIEAFAQYKKEAPQANFWTTKMIEKVTKTIGYGAFSLGATPANAAFVLKGYEYEKSGTLPLETKLRPGKYTLQLTAAGHSPKQHIFTLQPNQPIKLKLVLTAIVVPTRPIVRVRTPVKPPPATKPRLLPWIAVGTAGALLITGIVIVGLSAGNQGQIDNPDTPAKQAQDALYQRNWQTPTGWVFVGLGAAVGIGAVVLFLMKPKQTPPPTAMGNTSIPAIGAVPSPQGGTQLLSTL